MMRVILDAKEKVRSVLLLLILCVSPSLCAEGVRIEVRSSWNRWGHSWSTIIIAGGDSKYLANGHPVPAEAIKALFVALGEPPVDKPSLENCGIDSRWLSANLEFAQKYFIPFRPTLFNPTPPALVPPDTSPQQISLFRSHFTDVEYVQQAFEHDFKVPHTDDYPEMGVKIWRDGRKVSLHSDSQHLFMLPWIVDGNLQRATFNCHISRGIASLLPSDFTNRERLLVGDDFRRMITQQITDRMEHMWDTEEKLGPDLARIRARFTVADSQVSGPPCLDGWVVRDNCLSWNADLKAQNLPAYMHLDVSLTYNNGRLAGADRFLARIDDYVALVRSVPWLAEFMSQHPNNKLELHYGPERSFDRNAVLSDLAKELRDHRKNVLADGLIGEVDNCALLQIEASAGRWSRWVVFPNREMLLWCFSGDSALKWKAAQLDAWDCGGFLRCTGVVIEPDGTLAPR